MKSRIPNGHQKNKVNLILNNSELDNLEWMAKEMKNDFCLRDYILEKINKARRTQ